MFDILKDELVGLMIRLSGEYRDGIPAVRLSQSNMKIFYNLCKEHELEGVVSNSWWIGCLYWLIKVSFTFSGTAECILRFS